MVEYIVAIDVTRVRFPADATFCRVHQMCWFGAVLLSSVMVTAMGRIRMTLAGLEPAIFGSEDQRLIH